MTFSFRPERATPMERMSVVELRETLAREIASLPEALRACTGEALANQLAPIFSDEDHERCAPVHASFPSRLRPAPRVPQTNM